MVLCQLGESGEQSGSIGENLMMKLMRIQMQMKQNLAMVMVMVIATIVAAIVAEARSSCKPSSCRISADSSIAIEYPFSLDPGCGASPSSLLSCADDEESADSLRWIGFNTTLKVSSSSSSSSSSSQDQLLAIDPIVTGILMSLPPSSSSSSSSSSTLINGTSIEADAYNYINITWNPNSTTSGNNGSIDPISRICPPIPASELLHYFPDSSSGIVLSSDTSGLLESFQFSQFNLFLLFNCSNDAALSENTRLGSGARNSSACSIYATKCQNLNGLIIDDNNNDNNSSADSLDPDLQLYNQSRCFQIAPQKQELDLRGMMESLSCSHFQLLVSPMSIDKTDIVDWRIGIVQLSWRFSDLGSIFDQCQSCIATDGYCGYGDGSSAAADSVDNFQCVCSNGTKITPTDCNYIQPPGGCGERCKLAVGLVIGGAMVSILTVACVIVARRRSGRFQRPENRQNRGASVNLGHSANARGGTFTLRPPEDQLILGNSTVEEFAYEDLARATAGFSEGAKIGEGGFGAVYLGELPDGRQVAVKRLYQHRDARFARSSYQDTERFCNEVRVLSSFRHPNLVRLYGFCSSSSSTGAGSGSGSGRELLLVFEYVPGGTVHERLHRCETGPARGSLLPWPARLRIGCETARALAYLHSGDADNSRPPIFHRDVKTANLLLDAHLCVKVADFGLSRLVPEDPTATHVSTAPQGTPGYVDPDYHRSYRLTDKSDVYSFGVVLAELVSGLPAVDVSRSRGFVNLASLALAKISAGSWSDLLDPSLLRSNSSYSADNCSSSHDIYDDNNPSSNTSYGHVHPGSNDIYDDNNPSSNSCIVRRGDNRSSSNSCIACRDDHRDRLEASVNSVLELAFSCLQEEKDDRPPMAQVAAALADICRRFGYAFDRDDQYIPAYRSDSGFDREESEKKLSPSDSAAASSSSTSARSSILSSFAYFS